LIMRTHVHTQEQTKKCTHVRTDADTHTQIHKTSTTQTHPSNHAKRALVVQADKHVQLLQSDSCKSYYFTNPHQHKALMLFNFGNTHPSGTLNCSRIGCDAPAVATNGYATCPNS